VVRLNACLLAMATQLRASVIWLLDYPDLFAFSIVYAVVYSFFSECCSLIVREMNEDRSTACC